MSLPPFERRPVCDSRAERAEAKRLAYASMRASGQAPTRKAKPAPLTPDGQAYLEAEQRWERDPARLALLRRPRRMVRRPQRVDGSGRDLLHLAKAKRARLQRTDACVHGSHPTPQGRYSDDELQKLGERGLALQMPDGSYAYPIVNLADLMNAVAAYERADGDKTGVRARIVRRAREMGLDYLLPKGWGEFSEKPGPKEAGAAGVAAPGGPIQ
jgi:hypothetical protein